MNIVWKHATRLAFLELPEEAMIDVIHVPMFAPATRANALGNGSIAPDTKKTTIEVTTDDDCTTAVNSAAIDAKMSGFDVELNTLLTKSWKNGSFILDSKSWIPMKRIPNPAMISPNVFTFLFLESIGIAPRNAKNANIDVKSKEDKEMMNVVNVVPILAPIIQAQAWNNVIVPTSARRTSVTLVTSDDCTSAV